MGFWWILDVLSFYRLLRQAHVRYGKPMPIFRGEWSTCGGLFISFCLFAVLSSVSNNRRFQIITRKTSFVPCRFCEYTEFKDMNRTLWPMAFHPLTNMIQISSITDAREHFFVDSTNQRRYTKSDAQRHQCSHKNWIFELKPGNSLYNSLFLFGDDVPD